MSSVSDMATSVATRTGIGVVGFLNTLPLIDGLEALENIVLRRSVPSLLLNQLVSGEVDLALCSSIDYQRSPVPLLMVPVGLLGCRGATMTVRLYAQRPIEEITTVHCDTDSHTSVALLQILLREMYGLQPRLIDYEAREHVAENRPLPWPEAMLLIGDKVVSDSPPAIRYPTQLDLGELWFRHTGRPFVFAAWMARKGEDHRAVVTAARALDRQRRLNALRIDSIISRHARGHGWPEDLARTYLSKRLVYRFGDEERAAMECFFDKAHEHRLIDAVRPIELLDLSSWRDSESHHQDPA